MIGHRDRAASEGRAKAIFGNHKREYDEACHALAEAVLEHMSLEHADVVARLEVCRATKEIKDDSWRVLQEVMFK